MKSSKVTSIFSVCFLAFSFLIISTVSAQSSSVIGGQLMTGPSNRTAVSVSSSVNIEIDNSTYKSKETTLKNAVIGFLTSGPNVLKKVPTDQPEVKTKITDQITNTSQFIEGVDATNAVLGIEVSRALKKVNSSSFGQQQPGLISIETASSCKPSDEAQVSCSNSVTIR